MEEAHKVQSIKETFLYFFISALDTSYVSGVTGYRTSLPCDLTPPVSEQSHDNVTHVYTVYLVLWYREDQGEPLYRSVVMLLLNVGENLQF